MLTAAQRVLDRRPEVRVGAVQRALEPDHQRGKRRPELMGDVGAERALAIQETPELSGGVLQGLARGVRLAQA